MKLTLSKRNAAAIPEYIAPWKNPLLWSYCARNKVEFHGRLPGQQLVEDPQKLAQEGGYSQAEIINTLWAIGACRVRGLADESLEI